MRLGKQVENQVSTPSSSTQASTSPSPTPPPVDSGNTEKDKSVENVHKPIAPYPNRPKNKQSAQIDKVREVLIKSRLMHLFLMQFLGTWAPRRERLMYPKRFF